MRVVSKLLFLLFVVSFGSFMNAETKTWSRTYSLLPDRNDFATDVIPDLTNEGLQTYLIAGNSSSLECCTRDVWLMMLNQNGSIISEKQYVTRQDDFISSIEKISDGYILAGGSLRNHVQDAWIMKVDRTGNIVWQKFMGSDEADQFDKVKQTSDQGFIAVGQTASTPNKHWAIWLVKFNASGEIEWQKSYDSGTSGGTYSLALALDGFIIAGPNFSVIRFDNSGNILWAKSYGGPKYDQAFAIVQAQQEGFILTGSTVSFGKGARNLWILRIDASGKILWQKVIGLSGVQDGQTIIRTNDGGNIIAGRTDAAGAGGSDGFLMKMDRSGNVQWERTYGGQLFDSFRSVCPTHDHGYVAVGYTKSFESSRFDAWVLKLDQNGFLSNCSTIGKSAFIPAENTNATAVNRTKSELQVSTEILDREFVVIESDSAHQKANCNRN